MNQFKVVHTANQGRSFTSEDKSLLLILIIIKGALSGLRRFLATESPLKMIKNPFYFTSKALFVLKIFKFLC